MEIDITCCNRGCAWTFTVKANEAISEDWTCPKCGTFQHHEKQTSGTLQLPDDLDAGLAAALQEANWCISPARGITRVIGPDGNVVGTKDK